MKINGVIVAAGSGSRMGAGMNKVYMELEGEAVLKHTVNAMAKSGCFDKLVIVTGLDDIERCSILLSDIDIDIDYTVCPGGETRQESVYLGLLASGGCDYVAIHDGARALVEEDIIKNTIEAAIEYGAAAPGVHPKDTLKAVDENGLIEGTIDRELVYNIQTPQVFRYEDIVEAHEAAMGEGISVTDDCMLMECMGKTIKITEGSYDNIKLTTPEDMYIAKLILERRGEK